MFHYKYSNLLSTYTISLSRELPVMINKILFISFNSRKSGINLDILQRIVMHYIIALTNIHFPKINFERTD